MARLLGNGLVLALIAGVGVAVGAGPPRATPTPPPLTTLTDHYGRTVPIPPKTQRIISLAPSNTEILFALGLGDRVIGVTDVDDYPPEVAQIQKVGSMELNMEKITSLAPDLVLAADINRRALPRLEQLGLPVLVTNPKSLEEILASITLVGQATGREKEASTLVASMRARMDKVKARTVSLRPDQRPRVLYLIWHEPIWTTGKGTFMHELIGLAGGQNIFADLESWKTVSLEAAIDRDPQVIFTSTVVGMAPDTVFRWAKEEGRLGATSARKEGKVFLIKAALVERPGPRIVEGLETVALLLHGNIFR